MRLKASVHDASLTAFASAYHRCGKDVHRHQGRAMWKVKGLSLSYDVTTKNGMVPFSPRNSDNLKEIITNQTSHEAGRDNAN